MRPPSRGSGLGAVLLLPLAAAALAEPAPCQSGPRSQKPTAASLERELARRRQELAQKDAEEERWMDLLVRHHLGLTAGVESVCGLTDAERARPRAEIEKLLAGDTDEVARSSRELEQRQRELRELRTAIEERRARAPALPWQPAVEGPPPGEPLVPAAPPGGAGRHEPVSADEPDPKVEAPPPPVLIRGAAAPMHSGIALFMAGEPDKAAVELEKAVAGDAPPLIALFYLARAREKLGETAVADGLFLQIEALGEERDGGQRWVSAARMARQHMNWMRDHGGWHLPPIPGRAEPPE